jgi:hypothetical protein
VRCGELLEEGEIPMQIFRRPEVQGQEGAGRIIDGLSAPVIEVQRTPK